MPDVITLGETMAALCPSEAGPLRYVSDFRLRMAGAESNFAVCLCKLGRTAGWVSRVGADELGHFVRNAVRAEGVDTSNVIFDAAHRTGLMLKQLSSGETSVFYYRENSAASHLCPADLDEGYIKTARVIHLTGITPALSESCAETVKAAAAMAKNNGQLLSFDPNIRRKLWGERDCASVLRPLLLQADIALLGLDEARTLLGTETPEATIEALRAAGVRYIAVKDGGNGAWAANETESVFVPPVSCRCIDPVGAGDAFNAGFLAGLLEDRPLEVCAKMGAAAGALATETPGDIEGCPDRARLDAILNQQAVTYR